MKLITKIPVTYANSVNTLTTGIIEGNLFSDNQQFRFEDQFDSAYAYEYKTEDGYVIENSLFIVTKEETNALYELVKSQVPTGLSYTDSTLYLYYLGMKVKMAEKFNISINDIEIV
jgi:hypothetical protein